jgi:hypothetical protein
MENVTRIEAAAEQESERRARFGPLVVAYFLRAIDSLNAGQRGPQLATRRVWSEELPAPPSHVARRHPWG